MPDRKNSTMKDAGSNRKKAKTDLREYFGALKDNPVLDQIEADSKRMRAMARPRADSHECQSAD